MGPTELEMHRADYTAIRKAGFESPGELLSAYETLLQRQSVLVNGATLSAPDLQRMGQMLASYANLIRETGTLETEFYIPEVEGYAEILLGQTVQEAQELPLRWLSTSFIKPSMSDVKAHAESKGLGLQQAGRNLSRPTQVELQMRDPQTGEWVTVPTHHVVKP